MASQVENAQQAYIGRFAPSPTGPLHFGSLLTAVASYLDARSRQGKWLLRIEDVDRFRTQEGSVDAILNALEIYHFQWDSEIIYQTERDDVYANALSKIAAYSFPCNCTRKYLREHANTGKYAYLYPGFCRNGLSHPDTGQYAIRVKTNPFPLEFTDAIQGYVAQNLEAEVGDFILKRSDGLFAYHLAVVVDDALQGVTHIVRGADLLDNTPRHLYLQRLLGYTQPGYAHIPVAVDHQGKKLSKQNHSKAVSLQHPRLSLWHCLKFLGQAPPSLEEFDTLEDLWTWGIQHWQLKNVPKQSSIQWSETI